MYLTIAIGFCTSNRSIICPYCLTNSLSRSDECLYTTKMSKRKTNLSYLKLPRHLL
ncbi:hypothetical protein Hanom_Chr01g00038351 [Helianthus anomalus]